MIEMTELQEKQLDVLKQRWDNVGEPYSLPCDDCVMVEVSSNSTGMKMTLGIETDGHCHS